MSSEQTVNERLKVFINFLDLNANSFSQSIGNNSNVVISKILRGASQPSFSTLEKIKESYPDINIDWLLSGEGKMMLDDSIDHNEMMKQLNVIVERQKKHIDILMAALDKANKKTES
jgi:hypothetical protein